MNKDKNEKSALLLKSLRDKRENEDKEYDLPNLNNKFIKLFLENKFIPFEVINLPTLIDRNILLKRKNPIRISNQLKHEIGFFCQIGNDVEIGCSQIDDNVNIKNGVKIGDNVHILENSIIGYRTQIKGYHISEFEIMIIGKNVIVGNDCKIFSSLQSNSIIGDGCSILGKSILGKIKLGNHSNIENSLIGFNFGDEIIGNFFVANSITTHGKNEIGDNCRLPIF